LIYIGIINADIVIIFAFNLLANDDFKEAIQRVVKLKGQYHARPNRFNQNALTHTQSIPQ